MQISEARIAAIILDERRIAYVVTDTDLRIVEMHGSVMLLGASSAFVGQTLYDLVPELVGSEEMLASLLSERLERFELPRVTRDVTARMPRYLSMVSLPYRNDGGTVVGILHLVEDVTEAGVVEQRLSQQRNELRLLQEQIARRNAELVVANEQLVRAMKAREEFLATMTHELRTPLTTVLGLSEALLREFLGPLNETQLDSLRTIAESGTHLLSLINDLLDYARAESEKLELIIGPVSVGVVTRSALRMVTPGADRKQIAMSGDIDIHAGVMQGDERRIKQILVNLLSNAVKFTPVGGTIQLTTTIDDTTRTVVFAVADTGIGIAPDNIERIFQPFQQVDSELARHSVGSGLGLTMARYLARLHGGDILVTSKPDVGSTFRLTLPWTPIDQDRARIDAQDSLPPLASMRGARSVSSEPLIRQQPSLLPVEARTTILIVDDDPGIRGTLAALLAGEGHALAFAADGAEALALAASLKPDLILLDVMLPEMDGFAVCRAIRNNPELAEVPIVMLTAMEDRTTRLVGIRCGADDFVSKPFDGVELAARVRTITQLNRYRRLLTERARSELQLQRFNADLTHAYDATLEGWARALELRDYETEGHARRVTELTITLARTIGVPDEQIIHIRRGALLHDIGKIGIPDQILRKPGRLTEDEMAEMRQHTAYAYQMLSPIDYLHPALDIPYCHHEKWDGTGYPRQLRGEEIPLAARIFAIVDVYDALNSDRPYRSGWPESEVRAYLRKQAGIHFESQLVTIFLDQVLAPMPIADPVPEETS